MDSLHMQNNDIQDSDNSSQDPDNTHHIQNLVVYINSFNTHNSNMQDSGNHGNCSSLSSYRSIISDEAKPFIRPLAILASIPTPWPTSLAKYYSHSAPITPHVLHRAILIHHSFLLSYLLRHSFVYWALGEAYHHSYWRNNSYSPTVLVGHSQLFQFSIGIQDIQDNKIDSRDQRLEIIFEFD